ncbi:MAG TPA: hypothetical protein QF641_03110 [Candidatus Thalassarchaeaceae archaeon]|nr:hypothetical protein [Candidatus Thalassarchaeaceae archaeon]
MRVIAPFLLTLILLLPMQVNATSETLWNDAREGVDGGTISGPSIPVFENMTETSMTASITNLQSVIEVYTATWCQNCVESETALDDAIANSKVTRIHYHRHLFETMDPFGSNSTEDRWVSSYGDASTTIAGQSRLAPAIVFDGERMYMGTNPKSESLQTDYSTSLAVGSNHPFQAVAEDAHLSLDVVPSTNGLTFQWSNTGLIPAAGSPTTNSVAWILFVEDAAYYPEGSNGVEYYRHVLHEAVMLPEWQEGSMEISIPQTWDGSDMSAVLVLDWEVSTSDPNRTIPAPGVVTLMCMLAALVPRRRTHSCS